MSDITDSSDPTDPDRPTGDDPERTDSVDPDLLSDTEIDDLLDEPIDLSFLAPPTTPGSLGRLGSYDIRQILGRGGCGIVLLAQDEKLHRPVAIKVMRPELTTTSPARKRFLREARAAAAVRHDNIVTLYAVEETPLPFLVMEYVAGPTLQQRLDTTGPLPLRELLIVGAQIARGLAAAHERGLVHRDIKPGNILLEEGLDRVRITDFGLARSLNDTSVTRTALISGTPNFMSPEQAQGLGLDPRSDLFSLGSVLYCLYTGRPPFRDTTAMRILFKVVHDEPRPIRDLIPETPAWFEAIIARLHAKSPDDRYASAREVAQVLERCLVDWQQGRPCDVDGKPVDESVTPTVVDYAAAPLAAERLPRPRRGWRITVAAFVGLAALAFGITQWMPRPLPGNAASLSIPGAPQPPAPETMPITPPPPAKPPAVEVVKGGKWIREGDEFVQAEPGNFELYFGDPEWTDYDVTAECLSHPGLPDAQGGILHFRASSPLDFLSFNIGSYGGSFDEAVRVVRGQWSRDAPLQARRHQHNRWQRVHIRVRGTEIECRLDDLPPIRFTETTRLKGRIALVTWNSSARWRNLRVTAPDGTVLWTGFPDVPQ